MTRLTRAQTTATCQQLVDGLNQDLAGEYQSIIRSIQYAASGSGLNRLQLAQFLSSQIPGETAHAQPLAQKIAALGGVPANRQIMENVMKAERETIAAYTEQVQQAHTCGDIALCAELETQTQDETGHAEELETILRNWPD